MQGIRIDENGDLIIRTHRNEVGEIQSGLLVDENSYQCAALVVLSQKGEFKEYPSLGFGVENWKHKPQTDSVRLAFESELSIELKAAGFPSARVRTNKKNMLEFDVEL